ncbi:MAG: HPr family phosphocarrier protein [Pseudomonadota bacterium]
MRKQRLELINPLGLHARAAAKLVDVCQGFASSISLRDPVSDKVVDGKSIMNLLLLGAPCGTELTVVCEGEDEEAALQAVSELINAGFYELDDPA